MSLRIERLPPFAWRSASQEQQPKSVWGPSVEGVCESRGRSSVGSNGEESVPASAPSRIGQTTRVFVASCGQKMSSKKRTIAKPAKKKREKKPRHFPEDAFWFQWSFDPGDLMTMGDFVVNELDVPRTDKEFDNVMVRCAWAMAKLVERWGICGGGTAGVDFKTRVRALLDAFLDGTAASLVLRENIQRPAAPESQVYGDHDLELTEKAKAFFDKCHAACAEVNRRAGF